MEVINGKQNNLCSQSPSAKAASNLDGQRSELMLPKVSQLAEDNPHRYGESRDQCLLACENNEGGGLKSANKNSISEGNKEELNLHSSQGYNPQYSIKTKQQRIIKDGVVFKGSNKMNVDLFYISDCSESKACDTSEYDDQVYDENRSSSVNSRVHRAPVPRQDSVAFDFTLGGPNETFLSDTTKIQRLAGKEQEKGVIGTYNNKNITRVHRGQKEQSHSPSDFQRQTATKQILLSDAVPTPSIEHGEMIGKNQFLFKSFAVSESGFVDKAVKEMCSNDGSEQVNINNMQAEKENRKSYFFHFENSDESKSSDSTKQNYSNSAKDKGTVYNQFSWYAKFCFIIVVMVMLVYLHVRVAALESSVVSSETRRCQCDKTILTQEGLFIDQANRAHVDIANTNFEDAQELVMKYFDNENGDPPADGDTAYSFQHSNGNKNIQTNLKQTTSKSDRKENKSLVRMQIKNPRVEKHVNSKSATVDASTTVFNVSSNNETAQSLLSKKNSTEEAKAMQDFPGSNFRAVKTFPEINDVRRVELNEVTQETTWPLLSRRRRNSQAKKAHDPKFKNKLKKPSNQESRNTGPQVESFDIPYWSEFFHYPKHFIRQDPSSKHHDCTTQHSWGHGIEACKDSSIIFPEKHSILPFYRPTITTAKKNDTKRMIHMDARGRFLVNISGDYLFQQNITILSDSERHFLALYLNDQATLACQHGGFVCPHTNDGNSSRYKVCNIFGVLELRKGDILDIRTMESHMTVRADVHKLKTAQVKFILLNKIK